MIYNSHDFTKGSDFLFSPYLCILDVEEFLSFIDIPYSSIEELRQKGLSNKDILESFGWSVLLNEK